MRRQVLAALVDPARTSILEIGPAFDPIFARRDGYRTRIADHTDRAGLTEKYAYRGNTWESFEDVDFVLLGGAKMAQRIDERFDLVVAAHVLEHSTSLVDFVNQCAELLTENGTVVFVVPDRRYCFDRFRERSSLGSVIDAARNPSETHSVGTVTECHLNSVKRDGRNAWSPSTTTTFKLLHTLESVQKLAAAAQSDQYLDVHHWVFTPHHLRLLFRDLAELGYIAVRETLFHDTVGCEFFIGLSRTGDGPGLDRAALLVNADAERALPDSASFEH